MATRIYQGRIETAEYETPEEVSGKLTAMESLVFTHSLFQDATNYHMAALAAMAAEGESTAGMRFARQVERIWQVPPKGGVGARTLQQSVTSVLNLPPTATFDEVRDAIFEGCERPEVLPYVQQFIIQRTQKGEGAIQQEGRSLLPKLCDVHFSGNYDFSSKEKRALEGKSRLITELNRADVTQAELEALANEMELSWAGIKTQPNPNHTGSECYTQSETLQQVATLMGDLSDALKELSDKALADVAAKHGLPLPECVRVTLAQRPSINSGHLLAKNNKANPLLKQLAVFFMYYPCPLTAQMLATKLGKITPMEQTEPYSDFFSLENDPILLARGARGYIYRGFTALPEWAQTGATMYSSEWDILAFKEALKTLHSYELKTKERQVRVQSLQLKLNYILNGEGKDPHASDDTDSFTAVLKGDPRYELLCRLVKEISPCEQSEYTISSRALLAYDIVREQWLSAEQTGKADESTLRSIVRKVQGQGGSFGAGVLFEALCAPLYHPIWHPWQDPAKKPLPRSSDVVKDFAHVQALREEIEKYSQPVNITAAEPTYSPRQLSFSDIGNFGPGHKGCEFIPGCKGGMRLRVAIRNTKGHLTATSIKIRYSSPRFERDELGVDSAQWLGSSSVSWLQPMMKALDIDVAAPHLKKDPAVSLQISSSSHSHQPICHLNFPVTLDLESLQQQLGKAARWKGQLSGAADEKLHLHWPATIKNTSSAWWRNPQIRQQGFTVLGVDLGMRYAGAWSLNHIQLEPTLTTPKGSVLQGRYVGSAEGESWFGYCRKQGIFRLDGEGKLSSHLVSRRPDYNGPQLADGVDQPTADDMDLVRRVYLRAQIPMPSCIGEDKNVLQWGNQALKVLGRLISRCRRYQSLYYKLKSDEKNPAVLQELLDYFDHNETTRAFIPGMPEQIRAANISEVGFMLMEAILVLRADLPRVATDVANLILPRKHGQWKWVAASCPGHVCAGALELERGVHHIHRHVHHRGGLSVARLSQLEELRSKLQSLNRVLWNTPGEEVPFGSNLRGLPVSDPCPALLTKIEKVREQRVNQIAHEITAQALGVRLVKSRSHKNTNGMDILHGEYERIPGRQPVDFVVLENLSAYRTTLDKTRAENTSLMRWAHRHIVAKVKQLLEEVFGIPVLFTHSAYTSKFDSLTSMPGFRAETLGAAQLRKTQSSADAATQQEARLYAAILDSLPKDYPLQSLKLLAPKDGGEYFVSRYGDQIRVRNADMNAACNIAWRGIAAPESLALLHRVRAVSKKGKLQPKADNLREKALKTTTSFQPLGKTEGADGIHSLFVLPQTRAGLSATALYTMPDGREYQLLHGKILWGSIKQNSRLYCHLYNWGLLSALTPKAALLKDYLKEQGILNSPDDELPI